MRNQDTNTVNIDNAILDADSYKFSHYLQLSKGTQFIRRYTTPRSSKVLPTNRVMFYGAQMFVKDSLFRELTPEDLEFAEYLIRIHGLPFNKNGFRLMNERYGSTAWPISIQALPEGTASPLGVAQFTVENTDPDFPWVALFLETMDLRGIWYPSSVATLSKLCVDYLRTVMVKTSGNDVGVDFKLHDFGGRAGTCRQHVGIGASAHLINSKGSDTVGGLLYALRYYNADINTLGFSIPASEHATACAGGLTDEAEIEFFTRMVDEFGREGSVFACVSDGRDIYNAVEKLWGDALRERVLSSGATLVIRPDSGEPTKVLPELLAIAARQFGYTTNDQGYKVLHPSVRFIWGDGINYNSLRDICDTLIALKWSIENVAFGMGGALLNGVERDTFGYASKACWIKGENFERDIYKDPITDPGKVSLKGRITTWINDAGEMVSSSVCPGTNYREALREIYRDGELLVDDSFETIRARAASYSLL